MKPSHRQLPGTAIYVIFYDVVATDKVDNLTKVTVAFSLRGTYSAPGGSRLFEIRDDGL
jgi:hypothetical protein